MSLTEDALAVRSRIKRQRERRQRAQQVIGVLLLLAGYASLAVSPDTPSDRVLLRVAAGFGLLLAGFALAILPILTRFSRSNDDD